VRRLGTRRIPPEWITFRILAEGLAASEFGKDAPSLLARAVGKKPAFANAVQLAGSIPLDFPAIRDLTFENEDLTGIQLVNVDLRRRSFRNCDLTDATFEACLLNEATFDGAILMNTGFINIPADGLRGASMGELTRFFSVRVDTGRRIEDLTDASKWFAKRVGVRVSPVEPCAAAQQLRFIFMKYVYPDGTGRRSWLDKNGVLRGRRFMEAEPVLLAAVRYGYLVLEQRDRVSRPAGDKYSEMVAFVTGLKLTAGLREVLADVCDVHECVHVPDSILQ
jgi:hypothetical protein